MRWPGDRYVEIAVQHMAELNVGKGEIVAGKELPVRDLRLGNIELSAKQTKGFA